MFNRLINLPVGKHSLFLFGPRQTGKTTLVQTLLSAGIPHFAINLLDTETLIKYSREPALFLKEIEYWVKKHPRGVVFVDEIQKIPILLDQIHTMIEAYKGRLTFIMTGSSARKIKRAPANLLAGRAWTYKLFPLTYPEIGDYFRIEDVLRYGSLPVIFTMEDEDRVRTLKAYADTYLKEEILAESLIRNVPAFSRFLELAADQSGMSVNYNNFARETGVASKTIREYYQVLEDTLLAFSLQPYLKSARKRLVSHPIFYLFDLGVINTLCRRLTVEPVKGTELYGRLFEHFIILEIYRLNHYSEKDWPMYYWRTGQGAEVDLVLETDKGLLGVEIKSKGRVRQSDLRGLFNFLGDYKGSRGLCITTSDRPYEAGGIECLPWQNFLQEYFFTR
ncbi:MAG: ATP-binding protein [Nitrospirae bacterium]|nr:ATP-binding protein [Nitrospirota bacterium]